MKYLHLAKAEKSSSSMPVLKNKVSQGFWKKEIH